MARRTKNVVDYFPHVVTHGKTLKIIESKYSHLGYSFFFKVLEFLGKSENHYLDLRDEIELEYLCAEIKTDTNKAIEIFDLMARLGAIDKMMWGKRVVFSQNFMDNIHDVYERRKSECMNKRAICLHLKLNVGINPEDDDTSTQSKVEYRKVEKTKVFSQQTILLNKNIGLSPQDVEKFNDYWTESGDKDTKLRWEKEKTFSHQARMKRWKANNFGKPEEEPRSTRVKRNYSETPPA